MSLLERVKEQYDLLNKFYDAGEYQKIAEMYTVDSKLINPEYGTYEGQEGAARYYAGGKEKVGILKMEFDVMAVDQEGELVTGFGKYKVFGEEDAFLGVGWFMTIWKEIDGVLKFYVDVGS